MAIQPIPPNYRTVTPYIMVKDAPKLVDFLTRAFAGKEVRRTSSAEGVIQNLEMRIGTSMVMIAEAHGGWKPMPGSFYLYVEDTDAVYKSAIDAGGQSIMEPADQFYGDRNAGVADACGNFWWIATHVEDVSDEEITRRAHARDQKKT